MIDSNGYRHCLRTRCQLLRRPLTQRQRQHGAVLVEFALTGSILFLLFLSILQIGLIFHAKLVLNYAVFEAARRGAVNHARVDIMRSELGIRLAPLHGGDGSHGAALVAVARATAQVQDSSATQLRILNPTPAAFDDWGVNDPQTSKRVIPNAHLRHQTELIGSRSGVSLKDANLLKLQVTHGFDLKIPIVNTLITRAMLVVDSEHLQFYARGKFPLTSVATLRMQSEAWESEVINAFADPPGSAAGETETAGDLDLRPLPTTEPVLPGETGNVQNTTAGGDDTQLANNEHGDAVDTSPDPATDPTPSLPPSLPHDELCDRAGYLGDRTRDFAMTADYERYLAGANGY